VFVPAETAFVAKLVEGAPVLPVVVPIAPPFAYQVIVPVGEPGAPPPQFAWIHCGLRLALYVTLCP